MLFIKSSAVTVLKLTAKPRF